MNNKVKRIIDSYIKIGIEKISNINISIYYNLIDSKNIPYNDIFKLYNYAVLKNNIVNDKKLSKKIKKYSYFFDMEYQPIIYSTIFLLSFLDLKDKFSLYNNFINEIGNIETLENNLIKDLDKITILNKKMNNSKNILLNFIDIFKKECSYEIDNLDTIIQEKIETPIIQEIVNEKITMDKYNELVLEIEKNRIHYNNERRNLLNFKNSSNKIVEKKTAILQNNNNYLEEENKRLLKKIEDLENILTNNNLINHISYNKKTEIYNCVIIGISKITNVNDIKIREVLNIEDINYSLLENLYDYILFKDIIFKNTYLLKQFKKSKVKLSNYFEEESKYHIFGLIGLFSLFDEDDIKKEIPFYDDFIKCLKEISDLSYDINNNINLFIELNKDMERYNSLYRNTLYVTTFAFKEEIKNFEKILDEYLKN